MSGRPFGSQFVIDGLPLGRFWSGAGRRARGERPGGSIFNADDRDRDVILTPSFVGQPDELFGRGLWLSGHHDIGYILVREVAGQAVGAEHDHVPDRQPPTEDIH